jgi:hypothetical protein
MRVENEGFTTGFSLGGRRAALFVALFVESL